MKYLADNIIVMPLRSEISPLQANNKKKNIMLNTMKDIASTGDIAAVIDYLELLSKECDEKSEYTLNEVYEIINTYAYFVSCLDKVTMAERIKRWGSDRCSFLDRADKLADSLYGNIAEDIMSNVSEQQKNIAKMVIERIVGYINNETSVTLSFYNNEIPCYQVMLTEKENNGSFKVELLTGILYQHITGGSIKGAIDGVEEHYVFGLNVNKQGIHGMTKNEFINEFYTSDDGIVFKIENNAKIIDVTND